MPKLQQHHIANKKHLNKLNTKKQIINRRKVSNRIANFEIILNVILSFGYFFYQKQNRIPKANLMLSVVVFYHNFRLVGCTWFEQAFFLSAIIQQK
jgi:hypothetical protein